MTNLYGIESTENVQYDAVGLPVCTAKFMALTEEPATKDGVTTGVIVTWECVQGQHKGKQGKVWYLTLHSDSKTSNIAKQTLKRIADASGKPISPTSPIKGRVLTLEIGKQKKDDRYTEVKKYLPENYTPENAAPF